MKTKTDARERFQKGIEKLMKEYYLGAIKERIYEARKSKTV